MHLKNGDVYGIFCLDLINELKELFSKNWCVPTWLK